MPGETGVTVVTMLVCFLSLAYEAAGALDARHSLRPLSSRVRNFWQTSDASRRENAGICLNVIACDKRKAFAQGSESDEAIQLSTSPPKERWIASLALAMTGSCLGCLKFESVLFEILNLCTGRPGSANAKSGASLGRLRGGGPGLCLTGAKRTCDAYFRTYFCTRQFSVSATKISSRGLTAM